MTKRHPASQWCFCDTGVFTNVKTGLLT